MKFIAGLITLMLVTTLVASFISVIAIGYVIAPIELSAYVLMGFYFITTLLEVF